MDSEYGIQILLFVVIALLIGAGTKQLLKGTPVPYTVALLIIGLGLGLLERLPEMAELAPMLSATLKMVADVDPHIILYVFLPTLIFESAFAMEVHLFRRMLLQIAILAVPGLILATSMTALLAWLAFPWEWSWPLCFMFGALISATDPVAVVALLKEVSSRKRLETLIEGESLLNDGTAIVFFSLFYAMLTLGSDTPFDAFEIAMEFVWVVSLGVLIGGALGWFAITWVGRIFNEPMIEISISIGVAYLAFYIAEHVFHVSGVVAVVVLALMFASSGRTRVSPEVSGFLHHFWEMMAHIANTLIFLLVGILIASRVRLDSVELWLALIVLYIGIQVIRTIAVILFMPLLSRIGIGINREKATVLVWGGLRGAVSLALALTVAQNSEIAHGDEVLFLCAGIVVLTILINGSSMGWLLNRLGLDKLPPGKQATVDKAWQSVQQELHNVLPGLEHNEFLAGADWDKVYKTAGIEDLKQDAEVTNATEQDLSIAFRRRILETERRQYWTLFKQGRLGRMATHKLVEAVEKALDGDPVVSPRPLLYKYWDMPPLLQLLRRYQYLNRLAVSLSFDRMALGYDIARGFIQAQDDICRHLQALAPSPEEARTVRGQIMENKKETYRRIDQLRQVFPEVVCALETHAAIRLLLNRERSVIYGLLETAVLDRPEADRMIGDIEARMERLQKMAMRVAPPDPVHVLQESLWMKSLDDEVQQGLLKSVQYKIYGLDEFILQGTQPAPAVGIIVRGHAEYLHGEQDEVLVEQGGMIGLDAVLTQSQPPCPIRAVSPVEVLWIPAELMRSAIERHPALVQMLISLQSSSEENA